MQPSEALGAVAQVAVTLAGFAGIVVIFRPESVHSWSRVDKLRLHLLLTNSALPLADSLFGIGLLSVDFPIPGIWQWCSGFAFLGQLVVIVYMRTPERRITRAELRQVNKPLSYGIAIAGGIAMALQAVNFSVWNKFWPFFAMIAIHLIAAIVQFLRMVLLPPHA